MLLLRFLPVIGLIRLSLALARLAQRRPRLAGSARMGSRVALALARGLQGNPPDTAETPRL